MKNLIFASLVLAASATATFAQTAKPAMTMPAKTEKTRNVAILVYDGIDPLDLSGATDVFNIANFVTGGGYKTYTVGLTHDMVHLTDATFGITPKFSLADAPKPDIIIVPGAAAQRSSAVGKDPRVATWLHSNHATGQTVMSVCTGAFVVAGSGLFDGKNATTHQMFLNQFASQFPAVKTFGGVRYINDGNISSTAGVSSGIDGSLHLVEKFSGKAVADRVASVLQYRRDTPVFPAANKARVLPKAAAKPGAKATKLALDFDPVCGMTITSDDDYTATYAGKTYGFCSAHCRDQFKANPTKYLTKTSR